DRGRPSCLWAPTVTVYPAKIQPLQHQNLLVCSVNGFYPGHIEVRWFWNGHEEEAGVISTGLIQNGDWVFQTVEMLESVPQSGEVYICQVEHPNQKSPITVEWSEKLSDLISSSPTSDSAQSKMMSGTGDFVLGLLFLAVGLFTHFRNQKGKEPHIESGNRIASISCKYVYPPFCFPGHSGLQPTCNHLLSRKKR
ncbi:hypothetical protein FD754_005503, partial [Muntiacus muntjak]